MFLQAVLTCVGLHISLVIAFGPIAGPYIVEITKIEKCEDQGSGLVEFTSKITKLGRGEFLFKNNLNFKVPMDQHFSEELELQKWGNGGYRPKSAQHKLKNCEEVFKFFGDFMKNIKNSTGHSLEKCDVPAGEYTIEWKLDIDVTKMVPVMEYSKYRGYLRMLYKGKVAGCVVVYGEALPKPIG